RMRSPIRVAVLATTVDFGGIERVLLTLLQNRKPETDLFPVLFIRTDTEESRFITQVRDLGVPHETLYVNTNRAKLLNPVRNIREVIAIFRKNRFDLIHCHGYRADLIGLMVARYFDLPLISTCHGFIPNDLHLRCYNRL